MSNWYYVNTLIHLDRQLSDHSTELCLVYSACSSACEHWVPFDGLETGILNMDSFLIGHDVLRDYLTNFLQGRSDAKFLSDINFIHNNNDDTWYNNIQW